MKNRSMGLYQRVSLSDFRRAFELMGVNKFSYEGLEALYSYLTNADIPVEMSVTALCCGFTEYESIDEFHRDYPDTALDRMGDVIDIDDISFIIQH